MPRRPARCPRGPGARIITRTGARPRLASRLPSRPARESAPEVAPDETVEPVLGARRSRHAIGLARLVPAVADGLPENAPRGTRRQEPVSLAAERGEQPFAPGPPPEREASGEIRLHRLHLTLRHHAPNPDG